MRQGISLNDELRLPWLLSIHAKLRSWYDQKLNGVFACSSLKQKYRHVLNTGISYSSNESFQDASLINLKIKFILLNCDKELIKFRLEQRNNHDIIKKETVVNIIETQFETIEIPSSMLNCMWNSDNRKSYLVKEMEATTSFFYFVYVLHCEKTNSVNDLIKNIIQIFDFLKNNSD